MVLLRASWARTSPARCCPTRASLLDKDSSGQIKFIWDQGLISPGALASVFGTNMAGASQMAPLSNGVFPTTVAGTTVSVNGVNAPLVYVSPTQINFQIPWEVQPGLAVPVTVIRGA